MCIKYALNPHINEIIIRRRGEIFFFFCLKYIMLITLIIMKVISVIVFILKSSFIVFIEEMLNRFNEAIFNVDDKISPNIIGRAMRIKFLKNVVFLNFFISIAIVVNMINEGRITPRVDIIAPGMPYVLYPINVAILIANGPGVDSDIAIKSVSV